MPQKHSAITRLEIKVVIGIIAISIGLILSAVQRVCEASLRIQRTSNIKQIALAAQNYASDRRDQLPPVDGRVQFVGPSVHQALAVYVMPSWTDRDRHRSWYEGDIKTYLSPADPTLLSFQIDNYNQSQIRDRDLWTITSQPHPQ